MLGDRLKDLRKDNNLSQVQLAQYLNISVHTVSSYERGKSVPDDDTKIEIAKLFNVSLDYLLGLINYKCSYIRSIPIQIPGNLSENDIEKVQDYINMISIKNKDMERNKVLV